MYELDINYEEVGRYLGIREGKLEDETRLEIEDAVIQLKNYVDYKVEYKVFELSNKEEYVGVKGTTLKLEGQAIQRLLQDSEKCIVLAVTLGQRIDTLLRTLQVTNLSQAVMIDFCASSMVEHLCNQVNDEIKDLWLERNRYLTDRFSPGYGDLPLEVQKPLCDVLDTSRRMGLHVTSSGIMIPRKSITGIIGISEHKQKMKIKGCKYCDFYQECTYRKGGNVCG